MYVCKVQLQQEVEFDTKIHYARLAFHSDYVDEDAIRVVAGRREDSDSCFKNIDCKMRPLAPARPRAPWTLALYVGAFLAPASGLALIDSRSDALALAAVVVALSLVALGTLPLGWAAAAFGVAVALGAATVLHSGVTWTDTALLLAPALILGTVHLSFRRLAPHDLLRLEHGLRSLPKKLAVGAGALVLNVRAWLLNDFLDPQANEVANQNPIGFNCRRAVDTSSMLT